MLLNDFPLIMLRCLLLTVAIECAAAFVLGIRKAADQLIVVLANVLTNPVVVVTSSFVGMFCGRTEYAVTLALLEIAAVLVEALVYRRVMRLGAGDTDKTFAFFRGGDVRAAIKFAPIIVSLVLNCCSYFIGELLNKFVF